MTEDNRDTGPAENTGLEIAVIGMAGRFPGANHIHEFWENLKNGVEAIYFFTHQELEEDGVDIQLLKNSNYVKANGILEGIDYFDANFFGYTSREADTMDPQLRIFHECAWNALEDSGYCPDNYQGLIGCYAGTSPNITWEARGWLSYQGDAAGQFASFLFTNRDFFNLWISYKLNLKGPTVTVQTACSTSLVAIHLACQAILNGECDMALAGGINVTGLKKSGYFYQEGMILSPDGHCRAFDARAKGIVSGNGVGIVVLKRLEEAAADGDHIYAVVKGSAINNDGVRKVNFTAPSIEGETEAIIAAQEMAEVEPESIAYIETHGTGTELGDPVEIRALASVFKLPADAPPGKKNSCAVGSVKSNMGHLDAASGAAGFIKTVLSLYHRLIPPSLHFETPNPKIDFANTPFYVNRGLKEWIKGKYPRRAGVSSFGIGGTNAHVVLEEYSEGTGGLAPLRTPLPGARSSRDYQLILLSAQTQSALEKMTENLTEYLRKNFLNRDNHENPTNPGLTLADAAYTLQTGRKAFKYRQMLCSTSSVNDTLEILSLSDPGKLYTHARENEEEVPGVIFMFPGQGAQYVNMARVLYEKEPVFRQEMNRCFEALTSIAAYDLKEIIYPSSMSDRSDRFNKSYGSNGSYIPDINQTEIAQPLIFVLEYALAKLLMKWGITPYAMIGHSIGEYTAACLSGVFSLEDALRQVVLRGRLMQQMSPGSMLSISIAPDQLLPLLDSHQEVCLSAVNSTKICTVSGPRAAIDEFERQVTEKGYQGRRLHTSHAFHSASMDPIVKTFSESMSKIKLQEPMIPYISNLTGNWITVREAFDPGYWARHLRQTVRFADGLKELFKKEKAVFIEVGPGNVLTTFVRKHADQGPLHFTVNLIRHPQENLADDYFLLTQIGRLWLYEVPIDWEGFHEGEKHRRIPLPGYPFEKKSYPVDPDLPGIGTKIVSPPSPGERKQDMADWFYVPQWMRSTLPLHPSTKDSTGTGPWLILMDSVGLGDRLVKWLEKENTPVIQVNKGETFERLKPNQYILDPGQKSHYETLFRELHSAGTLPVKVIHLWNITGNQTNENAGVALTSAMMLKSLEKTYDLGFYSILWLAQSIGNLNIARQFDLEVIVNHMVEVTGGEEQCPPKAVVLGPVKVIPREYPNISCRCIDIRFPGQASRVKRQEQQEQQLMEQLVRELITGSPDQVVALRGNFRWRQTFEPVRLEKPRGVPLLLKEKGVYLVTGGLGGIGLTLAEHLVKTVQARVILTGRSAFPGAGEWRQWLDSHANEKKESRRNSGRTADKIQKLLELEALGGEVLVSKADAANIEQMQTVIEEALKRFGRIDGVIHAAGLADGAVIHRRTRENSDPVLAPKIKGALVLDVLLKDQPLDFFLLCSSLASFTAPFGQVAYCSANVFLDAFAHYRNSTNGITQCINWDTWQQVGMAVEAVQGLVKDPRAFLENGILPSEGIEIFNRVLESGLTWTAVSLRDISLLFKLEMPERELIGKEVPGKTPLHQRPNLSTKYIEPEDELELRLVEIFREFLGLDRIGLDDNFFELGMSSLDLIQINGKLKEQLNLREEIPVVTMFTHAAVRKLAQYIRETGEGSDLPVNENKHKPEELLEDAIDLLGA